MLLLTDKNAQETVQDKGPLNGCVCVCNYCMFNGPFFGTAQVSRYQKGKPIWILLKQETVSDSGISWAVCKSAPCSRQHPTTQYFTGWMPFLLPNQQHQSTVGNLLQM